MSTNALPPWENPRETLLSLPRPRRRTGFPIFTILSIVGYAALIWYAVAEIDSPAKMGYTIVGGFAMASAVALGLSIILTEVIRTSMVIAEWLKQKCVESLKQQQLEEGREQGLAEGRAEANARWREWNRRRLAAEAVGGPFDEPPPDSNV